MPDLLPLWHPPSGTGQWKGEELAISQTRQRFRRRAGQLDLVARKEEHVRRWIHRPQYPVRIEKASVCFSHVAVCQDDLENIAFPNIFLCLFYDVAIGFLGKKRLEFAFYMQRLRFSFLSCPQELFHHIQRHDGAIIILRCRIETDVDDEVNFLLQMIEYDDLVEQHEVEIVEAVVIGCLEMQCRFCIFDEIVRKISDETACKGWHACNLRCLVVMQDLRDIFLRMVARKGDFRPRLDMDDTILAIQAHLRIITDERIPAPALCVFHAFQEITV